MSRSDAIHVILITAPDVETAAGLARTLIDERLAACVNLVPGVRSFYRWDERVEDDSEVLLIVKTSAGRTAALADRVKALHPYDVPEIVALEVAGGSADYLDWVRAEASA